MKKVIILTMIFAMSFSLSLSAVAVAEATPTGITTGVTPTSGSGTADPIVVKAKWEMYTPGYQYGGSRPAQLGEDENMPVFRNGTPSTNQDRAQFAAPGVWGQNLQYRVCAVVHGPDGVLQNIRDVYAEIFWPQDREMHATEHELVTPAEEGGAACEHNVDGAEIDNPSTGCGDLIEQNELVKLPQADAIDLVCNVLQSYNNDLIAFETGYNYSELCNTTNGELVKGKAAVFCHDKTITWEDPAGTYKVDAFAYDTSNNRSNILGNNFEYLQQIGFAVDFSNVNYGNLSIGQGKRIDGNKFFKLGSNDSTLPTIKNLGNTRIQIGVAQDDMGLGHLDTSSTTWRVLFDARIGDLEVDWAMYDPFGAKGTTPTPGSYKPLLEKLDLSEIEEMDFSIKVNEKWPGNLDSYTGNMWLTAVQAEWGACTN